MNVTIAEKKDFAEIEELYWHLIDMSGKEPSFPGWKKGKHPSAEMLRENIEQGYLHVLKEEGQIRACAICNPYSNEEYKKVPWQIVEDGKTVWILHALAVAYEHRGQGLGKVLVKSILDLAGAKGIKAIHLDVIGHNIAAEKFYKKLGFQYICTRNIFYEVVGNREFKMFEYVL